jgi:hypothetical protein
MADCTQSVPHPARRKKRPTFAKKGGEFGMADAMVHEERRFY